MSGSLPDRRVHAECANFEVVRYNRRGAWYVETKQTTVPPRPRQHISVADAAQRALSAEVLGGEINVGLLGGRTFDAWVAKLRKRHNL